MPLTEIREIENGARLGIWEIDESLESLQQSASFVSLSDKRFLARKAAIAKKQWFAVRILLHKMLDTIPHVGYDNCGKPHLEGREDCISVSHSGAWVAVMIHPQNETGLDIQEYTPKIDRIHHKFMREDELLFPPKESNRLDWLLIHWGAKEAIYKWHGRRRLDFRKHMKIFPFECRLSGDIKAELRYNESIQPFELHYEKFHDCTLVYILNP